MKVFLIREKEHAEYNDSYAARLFEQGKAVPAAALKGDNAKYWLNKLKIGMERVEAEEAKDAEAAENHPAEAAEKPAKRARGDGK